MRKFYSSVVYLIALVFGLLSTQYSLKGQTVQVGTGSVSSGTSPINSCYNYNYTQQIYLASEVLAANSNAVPSGQLNRIRFQIHSSTSNSLSTANFNNWTIYIGFVTQNNFTSTTNWVPLGSLTQVYTGAITFPAPYANNWIDIPLTTPLNWNGTSNILVAVYEQVSGYSCTMYFNSTSTSSDYRTIYYYDDNTNPSPTTPPTAKGRSYNRPNIQFYFQEGPCLPATVYPTASTIITKDSICIGKSSTVQFQANAAMPAVTSLTYQLQTAPSATGPWTNSGTAITNRDNVYMVSPTASTYYRVQVLCSGTPTTLASAPAAIHVTNPAAITANNISRCGPGEVTLSANGLPGNTIIWYESLAATQSMYTGNNITAYFPATTTIYAAQGIAPTIDTIVCGAGVNTSSTSAATPFMGGWGGYKHEYLFLESELALLGITAGTPIHGIGLQVRSGGATYNGFQISMGHTNATALNTVFQTGTTVVRSPAPNVVTIGNNYYTFDAPFIYNGGNLVMQTCWSNGNTSNTYSYVVDDNYTFNATHYYYRDNQTPASVCGETSGGAVLSIRPKFYFRALNKCEGTRTPVTVTINTSPALTLSGSTLVCNNGISPITIASPASNYNNNTWAVYPATGNLYTNAAATTPYVANANANAVYFRSSVPGQYRVVVKGNNNITNCNNSDTLVFNVLPSTIQVTADENAFCRTGNTFLYTNDSAQLLGAPIQWQESNDNIIFTNIAGATNFMYTTPVLSATKYYRLSINGSVAACSLNLVADTVVVDNPSFTSINHASSCDSGIFNLSVVPQDTSFVVKWYEGLTSPAPIHTGTSFTTPFLNATTTYYASASGAPVPAEGKIGTGTSSTSGTPNPYYTFYYGSKNQFLVTAAELHDLGFGPGNITSIGFEVESASGLAMTNFTIKMGTTALTSMPNTWQTGLTQVFTTASFMPVSNTNSRHVLDVPFTWDGVSNVIIETCFNNSNWSSAHSIRYTSGYGFMASIYGYADNNTVCTGTPTAYTSSSRPNILLEGAVSCEGGRLPVTATILPKTPAVTFPQNAVQMCDGGTAVIRSVNTGTSYVWLRNGVVIPNATDDTLVISATGNYRLVVFNNTCADTSAPVSVIVNPNPIVNLGNDFNICPNTPKTLNAQNLSSSVIWDNNSTNHVRTISNPGTYYVTVTNSFGCKVTDTINIGSLPVPVPDLGADKTICENDAVILNPGSFNQYLWNNNATTPTINVADTGTYYVTVTNASGCKATDTVSVFFSETAFLEGFSFIPYFYQEQGKVQFNPINPQFVDAYSWSFGDSATSNAMSPIHTYQDNGIYLVKVVVSNATCPSRTYEQEITIDFSTNVKELEGVIAKLYPNPGQEKITIELDNTQSKIEDVKVLDVVGRNYNLETRYLQNKIEINTERLTSGMYTAIIKLKEGEMSIKFEILK